MRRLLLLRLLLRLLLLLLLLLLLMLFMLLMLLRMLLLQIKWLSLRFGRKVPRSWSLNVRRSINV